MEWIGLLVWVIVLTVAGPMAAGGLTAPAVGLAPPIAIGGIASCVLYVITEHEWLAWLSAGLGVGGAVVSAIGAAALVSDVPRPAASSQLLEETAAGAAGAVIPLMLTAAFAMTLAAVGVTTVG